MNEILVQTAIPGGAPGSATPKPVAPVPPPGGPGTLPPLVPAAKSVPAFGGRPSGRSGKFRFDADSPEGKEERRKDDALRKKKLRERTARLAEPPPLPSALPGLAGAEPPPIDGVGAGACAPGGAVVVETAPVIPWDAQLLKPFVKEIVDATEAARVKKVAEAAEEAALPGKLIKMISDDAKYVPAFKNSLVLAAPNAIANVLNSTGISSKYSDVSIMVLSMIAIYMHGKKVEANVAHLIDEHYRQRAAAATKPATPI